MSDANSSLDRATFTPSGTSNHGLRFRWLEKRHHIKSSIGTIGYDVERVLQIGEYQPNPAAGQYELVWYDVPVEVVDVY